MGYTFDFSVVWDNLGLFLSGAIVTVRLSLIAIAFGLAIGIIGALCRTSGNRLLNGLAATYVELIRKGEVVVLMGPSGSGKSTFIRTFNGLEPYQKGSIEVDGVKISHDLKNIEAVR